MQLINLNLFTSEQEVKDFYEDMKITLSLDLVAAEHLCQVMNNSAAGNNKNNLLIYQIINILQTQVDNFTAQKMKEIENKKDKENPSTEIQTKEQEDSSENVEEDPVQSTETQSE
jgi:hypothetical protein